MERLTNGGRVVPLILVAAGIALALVAGGLAVVAIAADEEGRRIGGFGLAIELPPSWEGAASQPSIGPAARRLVVSNAELPPGEAPLGGPLTRNGVRLVLWDYGGNLCPPDEALPIISVADLGERGRRTASYSFVHGGRLYRLVAIFAGTPSDELLAETNTVLRTLEIEPLPDQAPRTAQRDALWLQLVLVAARFWSFSDLDWDRQWNLAVPTGGPNSLHVWFTHAPREPEGSVRNDGVRASWGAQDLTLWAEPVGNWEIRRSDLDRLIRASLLVPRR